jgi:anaerobic ribonucleoside-triphosphate reductase activating protein
MTVVRISRLHYPVTTLGPGQRIGVWFQGCSIRCHGCISADTWTDRRGKTSLEALLEAIDPWIVEADGFTISGGEPFDQPEALHGLLTGLRLRSSADILVFSGHPFEAIEAQVNRSSGLIDALISDPFELHAPQTLALRGSDNQRLHLLTDLGRRRFSSYDRPAEFSERSFDLMVDEAGAVWLAGIPGRGDFRKLAALLEEQGHRVVTTEDLRSRAIHTGKQ